MEKSHPSTHLKFSVKVGTETVCTILTRNESVDIVTHAGATVTCQAVSKECHDQATLISERENICDEKNSEITERTQECEEPTESNVDNVELLLQLTAYINENKQNGLTQRSTSICNTEHQDEEIDESDGGDTPSGVVEHDMALHSPWLLARVITALQLLRGAWSSLWVPKRCDRMLRGDLIDHHASVPPEPLPATRDVVIRQTMGGKLLGRERQITNVRMMLVLPCDVNWVHLIPADPHNEDRMAILNMPRKMDLHLVFVATCFVQPATADVLDMLTVSEVTGTTQAVSGQYCVEVCVIITLLGDHTDCVSWAMEDKASLVPWAADTQSYSVWRLMENQAFLVQGHVDSKPATETRAMVNQVFLLQGHVDTKAATDSKAMVNQASLVQGHADSKAAADTKAMDNQASLEQGPVDSKASTDSKAMVNQASLAQGPADSKASTDSKAMDNQASLEQGPADSKASTDSKAMVNQASLAQGPTDSKAATDSKAMDNQASLEQGPVDSKASTDSKAMVNQASVEQGPVDSKASTDSKAMDNQASLEQGPADSKASTDSKAMVNQASLAQGPTDSKAATDSKAMDNQASLEQGPVDSKASTDSKAMVNQASLAQGPTDSKAATDSKAMVNQASLAQGPVDSQADAGTKAMVNQASLVQGSLDCLTGTESRAVENQGQADTVSLAVQIKPTLAIGSADSQTDTISKVAEHQTSPVSHCVDSRSDTVWRACEKQTSPVPRLINSQTSTEILILKPAVVPGALHIQAVTCPRLSATQAHAVSTADTQQDHVDMEVQETKKPLNDLSNETKPHHDHIHTASFNDTTANEDTGDAAIPGARMSTDQKTSSHKHGTTVIHHPDSRTRRRRRKAPSTQRRDRARTQRWIHKKINIHGQTKGAEKPNTHTSSRQLPKQEERTARSCTECVGMLLDHAGTTTEINMVKENIVLELEPGQFPDRMKTLYGAVVALLPNRKQWQLTKLMLSTVKGAHETCVHNMIRELKAEGKKLGHLLQYFSQENTKRDDIIKLITQIHQCDFCNQTAMDVIGGQCQV
ncbi:uncharacterized protein LOC124134398 [Haliotis rufescens]|uniref:uncharacterized protein LOC124134398 n=1 Tax=Haliotis rufescens TaxID=6454 RepID=UPI00201EF2B7|nr:uncharacterized protein LOC124134398 [Haliotis rufescens]